MSYSRSTVSWIPSKAMPPHRVQVQPGLGPAPGVVRPRVSQQAKCMVGVCPPNQALHYDDDGSNPRRGFRIINSPTLDPWPHTSLKRLWHYWVGSKAWVYMFGRVMLSSWGLYCQRSLTVTLYVETCFGYYLKADEANVHHPNWDVNRGRSGEAWPSRGL